MGLLLGIPLWVVPAIFIGIAVGIGLLVWQFTVSFLKYVVLGTGRVYFKPRVCVARRLLKGTLGIGYDALRIGHVSKKFWAPTDSGTTLQTR